MRFLIVVGVFLTSSLAYAMPVAPLPEAIQQEQTYQHLMNDPEPAAAFQSEQIDSLLNALYRTEAYIDDFESDLDSLDQTAANNPGFSVNPMHLESYENIQKMNRVSQHISQRIVYVYERLLQSAVDSQASNQSRDRALQTVNAVDQYFAALPNEDQLQLLDLIQELKSARQRVLGESSQIDDGLTDIDENDYANLKIEVSLTRTVTHRKARRSLNQTTAVLEQELKQDQDAQPANKLFTEISPGIGPGGNVDGVDHGLDFPQNVWALTFDDGPHPRYTDQIMNALKNHHDRLNPNGAPASFFWLAQNVKRNPGVVARAVQNGYSLNCHSWTHANLARANQKQLNHEINEAVLFERQAYGRTFRFYRCPYGACIAPKVAKVRQMLAALGLIHAYWSIDSLDWKLRNAARSATLIEKQMKVQKRGIILLHDIHPYSAEAAQLVLQWIAQQNDAGASMYLYTLDGAVDLHNHKELAGAGTPMLH